MLLNLKIKPIPEIGIILIFSIFFLLGCSKTGNKSIDNTPNDSVQVMPEPVSFDLEKIKERGTLRVILENNSTGYFLYKGRPMGFHYELAKKFCDENGFKIEVVLERDFREGFNFLYSGEGDIAAHSLTITKERKELIDFSPTLMEVRQMLVQRKPENYRSMKLHEIEAGLIKRPSELAGKQIHVKRASSYAARLENLSEETGVDLTIIEEFGEISTEELIVMVANREIDYTAADEDIAKIISTYFPEIDCNTALSIPTRVAWACRKNAPDLKKALSKWMRKIKSKPDFNILVKKYFEDPKGFKRRAQSDFSSITGTSISPYDDLIRKYAEKIDWDWRLLAGLIYQESAFDPNAKSWMGASGLMQLVPGTAKEFGAKSVLNPEQNIKAGTSYLNWLNKYWEDDIPDFYEREKFIMGSYNAGQGHVRDARRLAQKYGKDPDIWDDNVAHFLLLKSKPKYYNDPVVKSGYCRGSEPVNYVKQIYDHYEIYKQFIKSETEE